MLKSRLALLRKYSLKLANKIISVSHYSAQWLKKYVKEEKIIVIPNGIDLDEIYKVEYKQNFDRDFILVCIIGLMCKRKGADYFSEIVTKLMKSSKSYRFKIIGDFVDEVEKLSFFSKVWNFKENIYITGVTDNVYKEISECDIVIMTSREESLPRSVMEASFMGIPVVAFDVAGTKELLPPNYEYLVTPFNVDEFVSKIISLSDRNRIMEVGLRNRKFVIDNYSLDRTISELERILREISRK